VSINACEEENAMRLLQGRAKVRRGILACAVLCGASLASMAAALSQAVDLQLMKNDVQIFEGILDQALEQVFSNPFALIERTKGVYLQGFGTSFTFLINIKAATMETPFGTITRPEAADPKIRSQKIEELRQKVIFVLGKYGGSIGQLQDTEAVAVVAHIVDQNFSKKSQNKTIIIKVLRKDLVAQAAHPISPVDFMKKVQIVEY
jgi:hypothetical protein